MPRSLTHSHFFVSFVLFSFFEISVFVFFFFLHVVSVLFLLSFPFKSHKLLHIFFFISLYWDFLVLILFMLSLFFFLYHSPIYLFFFKHRSIYLVYFIISNLPLFLVLIHFSCSFTLTITSVSYRFYCPFLLIPLSLTRSLPHHTSFPTALTRLP